MVSFRFFRVFVFLIGTLLLGCGVREIRDIPISVVGVWDNTICADRLALNEDKTFIWSDDGTNLGSYWVEGDQINFKFSNKIPETYQYKVTDKELTLLKGNSQYEYVKIPPVYKDGKYVLPPPSKFNSTNSLCQK